MTLVQIEHFIACVEEKNYSRAAEKCYVSRQAISGSVKQLSTELGLELVRLNANNQPVVTEDGMAVYEKLKGMQNSIDDLFRFADEKKATRSGIRIAFSDTLAPILGHKYLDCLKALQKSPKSNIEQIAQIENMILSEAPCSGYDLTILLDDGRPQSGLKKKILARYPVVLTVPYTSEFYKKDSVHLEDLNGETLIHPVSATPNQLVENQKQYHINTLPISNMYSCAHTSIENAYLILDAEYESSDNDFKQIPIEDLKATWDITAFWKPGPSEVMIKEILNALPKV